MNVAPSVSLLSGFTASVFVLQKPGMIAGMIQKVNPFKSSQPKNSDTQSLCSELSSSTGSLTDSIPQPEKRVDPCCKTFPFLNKLLCFAKLPSVCTEIL